MKIITLLKDNTMCVGKSIRFFLRDQGKITFSGVKKNRTQFTLLVD